MANSKISGLSPASTPLAGTETLPIVQSGDTVKVPTNDLTVRNIRAAATTGILQVSGPTAGTTRTATVPDANWTAARTDAAQSFTGDQTLSTGNLVVSNGKGIDFSATPGTGASELLADYEEGTWTATYVSDSGSFASMTMSNVGSTTYTKVGNLVTVQGLIRTTDVSVGTASGNLQISGLPFTPAVWGSCAITEAATWGGNYPLSGFVQSGNSSMLLKYRTSVNGAESFMNVTDLTTGAVTANVLVFSATYRTT